MQQSILGNSAVGYPLNEKNNDEINYKYQVEYTIHDLILYALGIGCGSSSLSSSAENYKEEQKFIYENHPDGFEAFPTFLLSLGFRAVLFNRKENECPVVVGSSRMPTFPPPLIHNVYLEVFGRGHEEQSNKTAKALHISEKYQLHDYIIPVPSHNSKECQIVLNSRILSILTRSIGTFVTTQTHYYYQSPTNINNDMILLATSETKTLWLGRVPKPQYKINSRDNYPKNKLNGKHGNKLKPTSSSSVIGHLENIKNEPKILHGEIITLKIPMNQALLYRMSGDTNDIHVLGLNKTEMKNTTLPILHGLCTLGIITRQLLLKYKKNQMKMSLRYVECKFTMPVFIGDTLQIETYRNSYGANKYSLYVRFRAFTVRRQTDGGLPSSHTEVKRILVVDDGIIELQPKYLNDGSKTSKL